jgi:hypothetical protein
MLELQASIGEAEKKEEERRSVKERKSRENERCFK